MIYTTYNLAVKHNACERALLSWEEHRNKMIDRDEKIPLTDILDVLGFGDCLWALRATTTDSKMVAVKFAIACVDRVLVLYENKYPDDKRLRQAIEAAQAYLLNPSKKSAYAAADAAYAAADAAYAAADAVERTWQTAKLKELLEVKE